MARIIIGTRGSKLARTQTERAAERLGALFPDLDIVIQEIQTYADSTQSANIALSSFGEKGIFAKELESALQAGTIDLAVHSMKDMAPVLPVGLCIAAVPRREDPRDALLGSVLDALPIGARVGTGSVRRRALLLSRRPDLHILEIRGNIDTRVAKLKRGDYDAICLAVAGLNRLHMDSEISEILDPQWFTPDPGQGALCIEARTADDSVRNWASELQDQESAVCVAAERAFLREIGGSCKTPVGAAARFDRLSPGAIIMDAMVAAPDGSTVLRKSLTGLHADALGIRAAQDLRDGGAAALLLHSDSTIGDQS